jgi:hypothetical protein
VFPRYKDAGEALRRKQDKEREAAGLPPFSDWVPAPQLRNVGLVDRLQAGAVHPTRGRGQMQREVPLHLAAEPLGRFNHDKTLYVHLMGNLKKKSLLPVVVFTLSKKRCEENASTLTNLDLCTSTEKSEVHVAIEKALGRLKGVCFVKRFLYAWGPMGLIGTAIRQIAPSTSLVATVILTWFLTHDPRDGQEACHRSSA